MRHCYQGTFKDQNGAIVGSSTTSDGNPGTVTVYLAGTNTLANVYAASTGGVAVNSVSTDAYGYFYFWVDDTVYSLGQLFKITLTHADFITRSYDNISIIAPSNSFLQDGTGAVARSYQDKFLDVVHVKDFGAAGDGVTDDTAEIQAAITASTGKIIDFGGSENTYIITTTLTLPSETSLRGSGAIIDASGLTGTKHVMVAAGTIGTPTVVSSGDDAFSYTVAVVSAAAFAEETFCLLGSADHILYDVTSSKTFTAAADDIVTLSGSDTSILVENTLVFVSTDTTLPAGLAADTKYYVRAISGDTCKLSTTKSDVGIVNITDAGTGTHTISTGHYDYGEVLHIRDITGTNITFATPLVNTYTLGPMLYPVTWVNNITIDGLDIRGSNTAASAERGICLRYVKNFSVRNCKFSGIDYYGIEVNASIHGEVRNNFINGVFYDGATGAIFYGIILMNSCQYVNVHENVGHKNRHLVVTTANGSSGSYFGQPMFVNVTGNIFHDAEAGAGGRSFAFENHGFGRFILWDGNHVNGCHSGFNIENGSDNIVSNNIIYGYAYSGIIIGGSGLGATNLSVKNNLISGMTNERAGTAAILIEETGGTFDNLSICGNSIKNPYNTESDNQGIRLLANTYINCLVEGNSIYSSVDNIGYGIWCPASSDKVSILSNSIYGFRNGIGVESDKCVIKGNTVDNVAAKANGYGIYSNGVKSIIQGNTVRYMRTSFKLGAASDTNQVLNNQSLDCYATISDSGATNVKRDNDEI